MDLIVLMRAWCLQHTHDDGFIFCLFFKNISRQLFWCYICCGQSSTDMARRKRESSSGKMDGGNRDRMIASPTTSHHHVPANSGYKNRAREGYKYIYV